MATTTAATLPVWEPIFPDADRSIEQPTPRRSIVAEMPLLVAAALVIAFLLKSFVAQAFYIPSGSMTPTLLVNDRVVVSRVAYDLHDPRRGDIVVFVAPNQEAARAKDDDRILPWRIVHGFFETVGLAQPSAEDFIKRVIGLPGETVEGRAGQIYIDGRPLSEPYLTGVPSIGDFAEVTVPEGHLWVMGDNRGGSSDSRFFGPIPESSVVGRAVARVWPFDRFGFL